MILKGHSVLVVDNNLKTRQYLTKFLRIHSSSVLSASNAHSAIRVLKIKKVDILITNLEPPEIIGAQILLNFCKKILNIPVFDLFFFTEMVKPRSSYCHQFSHNINNSISEHSYPRQSSNVINISQGKAATKSYSLDDTQNQWGEFVGKTDSMRKIYTLIEEIAPSNTNVFILGETGTGKELVARAVHKHSKRTGPFVSVNCAAIPADLLESELFGHVRGAFSGAHKDRVGKFELADKGTLFLDEITEMRLDLQAKLLRILQEKKIERLGCNNTINPDVRIITSSNRDPENAVESGCLRRDLYYRINVVNIELPPLRERREDVPLLAHNFIKKFAKDIYRKHCYLADEITNNLHSYDWPGNIRELENMIERAVVSNQGVNYDKYKKERKGRRTTDHVLRQTGRRKTDLNPEKLTNETRLFSLELENMAEDISLESNVTRIEVTLLTRALKITNGNKSKAAHLLKTSERILNYKLKKYGLNNLEANVN